MGWNPGKRESSRKRRINYVTEGHGLLGASRFRGDIGAECDAAVLLEYSRAAPQIREVGRKEDEQKPASHGVLQDGADPDQTSRAFTRFWGNLMAGGSGVE
jgi:hypothetical protein